MKLLSPLRPFLNGYGILHVDALIEVALAEEAPLGGKEVSLLLLVHDFHSVLEILNRYIHGRNVHQTVFERCQKLLSPHLDKHVGIVMH